MATEYVLFPDRREEDGAFDEAMDAMNNGELIESGPDEIVPRLRSIDWAHPALLVYRSDGEDRWSQVLLGLNKPELDEREPSFLDGY